MGSGVGSPDADVVECPSVTEGDGPGVSHDVVPDSVVTLEVWVAWGGFGKHRVLGCASVT